MAFAVAIGVEQAQRYESTARQVRPDEIDAFIRESWQRLRERYPAYGRPFCVYEGCDADEAQLVRFCLPTPRGRSVLPAGDVAFTSARAQECEYPRILGAYDAVARYLDEHGLTAAGPPREVYLTDLDGRADLQMRIVFPLEARP